MNERELTNLPSGLPSARQQELVAEFRDGNMENKDEYVLAYLKLGRHIARQESKKSQNKEDVESVAYETILGIPKEIEDGRPLVTLYKYTGTRVRTRCREFVRSDFLVHVPYSSLAQLGKQPIHRVTLAGTASKCLGSDVNETGIYAYSDKVLAILYSLPDTKQKVELDRKEITNRILSYAATHFERISISFHLLDYTDREIAKKIGTSESTVRRARHCFMERLKQNADISTLLGLQ